MADSKYGRLFTEADVMRLLTAAWDSDRPGELSAEETARRHLASVADTTFPADEPLFLLRGQDLAAHGGAWSYAYEAQRVGASIEFVTAALAAANDLRDWALAHRDRVKVPD